jgi:release factor glutamine methyltransferase
MSGIRLREALQRASLLMRELEDHKYLAELILRHTLDLDRTQFLLNLNEEITPEQWEKTEQLIQKRLSGIPLQYLFGEQEFYGLPFHVDPTVLIPRPETEILVEEVLRRRDPKSPLIAADIGTGSGAIAVALAVNSDWRFLAVDIAAESLETAKRNSTLNHVEAKIDFLQGDMLQPLEGKGKVDILVSNPPYIPTEDIADLNIQVRKHEPMRALDGGKDGLDFYRKICSGLPHVLQPNGLVAFEVGRGQAQDVAALLLASGTVQKIDIIKDLAGIERIVIGN